MFAFAMRRGKHLQRLVCFNPGVKPQNLTNHTPNSSSLFGPRCYAARKLKPSKSTPIKATPTTRKRAVPSNNALATPVAATAREAPKQNKPLEAVRKPRKTKFPSHVLSSTTISITVNGLPLELPVPDQSFGGIEGNAGMWFIPATSKFILAKFLNRETLLLRLLSAVYNNLYLSKPMYALQILGRGSGKTRLLVEWICQALDNESVVHSFLNGSTNVIPNARITEEDKIDTKKKQRRQFINSLVDTVYNQRMILYNSVVLSKSFIPGIDAYADLTELIKYNIVARFLHTIALYKKKQITVTRKWLNSFEKNNDGKQLHTFALYKEYLDLFNTLITTKLPKSLMPFPNDGLHEMKIIMFGLDECQTLSRETNPGEDDRVYKLFQAAGASHSSVLAANTNMFCMAVGTYLPAYNSKEEENHWNPVAGSMDSLLHIKYLDQITKSLFNKVLPRQVSLGNEGSEPTLHKVTARMLLQTFIRTFGIPRAIAFMVGEIADTVPKAEALLQAKDLSASHNKNTELAWNVDTFAADAVNKLSNIEPAVAKRIMEAYDFGKWPEQVPKPAPNKLELLDIKAALCLAQQAHVKSDGFAYSPADLEECDYLVQWHQIDESTKCYTRPFFMLGDTIKHRLTVITNKVPADDDWICLEMTIASLVLHPELAKQLAFDNSMKGALFEKATAISLYVRFGVQQLETNTDIMELQSILDMDTAGLQVDTIKDAQAAWRGVVKLQHQINADSADLLEKIHRNHVVAVDVSNSEFADIIIPLTTADGDQIFLGLQAKQYQDMVMSYNYSNLIVDQPTAQSIAKNAMATLEYPNFYYASISPNQVPLDEIKKHLTTLGKAANLSPEEIESRKARLCSIPANAILSPLYLVFYGFAPMINALTEPANNSEQ